MKKDYRDYYEVLGIPRGADDAQIKRAYRNLALKYHPDRNPGADTSSEMKDINEAYAVLSDRENRRRYDLYGHAGLEGYTMEDIFGGVDFQDLFREFGLGDLGFGLLDSLFGGRRTKTRPNRVDLKYELTVDLSEVTEGAKKKIDMTREEECPVCHGKGAKRGGMGRCDRCHGTGQIVKKERLGWSMFQQVIPCPSCGGRGEVIIDACEKCQGKGKVEKRESILVHIPPGADSGYTIRLKGKGENGGDLYVVLRVWEHPLFKRRGDDIYLQKEVDMICAALGGEIEVEGLREKLKIQVPEGAQTGAALTIYGEGIPHLGGGGRGDEYVILQVITPGDLSPEEKDILRQFESLRKKAARV